MSALSSWRTALRIARREARRAKGRSALVVAMIAIPVFALSFAAVTYDMFDLTGEERANRMMGTADARITWEYRSPVEQTPDGDITAIADPIGERQDGPSLPTESELSAKLPAGTRLLSLRKGSVALKTAAGTGELNAVAVNATDPLTRDYVKVLEGRAPTAASEVALTKQATKRLGVGLGGTVTSADGQRSYSVVGLVEFPAALEQIVLFAPIGGEPPTGIQLGQVWLADTPQPVTWSQVRELNRSGIVVASRQVFRDPPPADNLPFSPPDAIDAEELGLGILVGGLALLEVVLMAGPAFAVSARRRQRQLALVAANGGTPAQVRRIVFADGVVLGIVGAGVGIAVGIAAAFVARPFIEELGPHARAGAYRVYPIALIAIACLAIITGLLAALVPAFVAARQNVVASLAGRRGVTRSRRRWIVVGMAMILLGTGVVIGGTVTRSSQLILAGMILGELGLVLCTPALVGLVARVGRIVPLAPRIALRDAARNRASAAPAISAVMAAVAGSVAIGLYVDSSRAQQDGAYQPHLPVGYVTVYFDTSAADAPDQEAIESILGSNLPIGEVRRTAEVRCAGSASTGTPGPERWCVLEPRMAPEHACPFLGTLRTGIPQLTSEQQRAARRDPRCDTQSVFNMNTQVIVDDGSALAVLTGASAADVAAASAVLRSGGVVVRDARYLDNGMVTLAVLEHDDKTLGPPDPERARKITLPGYLLTTGVAGAPTIVSPAALAGAGLDSTPGFIVAETDRPPTQAEEDRLRQQLEAIKAYPDISRDVAPEFPVVVWALMAAAALITLGATAIGTGLAAADGRADLSTLASVGASPRMRRGLSVSQAGVIAGVGSLLGAGAGLGAAIAVLVAINRQLANVWPGPDLMPISIPWLNLAAALLVVPVIAVLGAGLLTRSRLPIERRL